MIQLGPNRAQAGFDLAQTLAVGQLGKSDGEKLLPAGERLGVAVASIAGNAAAEIAIGEKADQLKEDALAFVHLSMLRGGRDSGENFKSRQAKYGRNSFYLYYLQDHAQSFTGQPCLHTFASSVFAGRLLDHAIHFGDAFGKLIQLDLHLRQQCSQCAGKPHVSILQDSGELLSNVFSPHAQGHATFEQRASDLIDDRRTPHSPALADSLQGLQVELIVALDRHRAYGRPSDSLGNL